MRYLIPTKLVGVSFRNQDGTERQELIKSLNPSEILYIEPEPTNPFDKNSHIIKNKDGNILGHINRSLALELSEKVKNNEKILGIKEWKVTGSDKHTLGINIMIDMQNDKR